ncbi:unnamed protein product [Absidia cylindrospora]
MASLGRNGELNGSGFTTQHMLSSRPLPHMRRARAGTMPSFVNLSQQQQQQQQQQSSLSSFHRSLTMDRVNNCQNSPNNNIPFGNWHRSGSLNLSTPPSLHANHFLVGGFNNSTWPSNNSLPHSRQTTQPPSPSTEQLLQEDSDFSIARTLRSIGLEDEHGSNDEETSLQQQQQQHLHNLLSSASSTTNRSRSYSVNATALYQQDASPPLPPANDMRMDHSSSLVPGSYASALDEFTSREQNRPRSSSMGLMEASSQLQGGLSWNNIRRSPLGLMEEDDRQALLEDMDQHQQQQQQQQLGNHYTNHHHNIHLLNRNGNSNNNNMMDDNDVISLGDTELMTNMMHQSSYNPSVDYTHDGYNDVQWTTPEMKLSHPNSGFGDQYTQYPQQQQQQQQSIPPIALQAATRSLWVGNVDGSVTVDILTALFSSFGPIESVRLLLERECAFVNFFYVEDAIHAKDEVLGRLGGRIGNCMVRIGFGKADMAILPEPVVLQPTRALWLGNIPGNTTPSNLHQLFSPYGAIESVRVLTQKKCGFINFETVESATAAKMALSNDDIGGSAFTNAGTKAGFAKVMPMKATSLESSSTSSSSPSPSSSSSATATATTNGHSSSKQGSAVPVMTATTTTTPSNSSVKLSSSSSSLSSLDNSEWCQDLWSIMKLYGADDVAYKLVKDLDPSSYFESIPPVPELGLNRKFDAGRLRDIRKRLDSLEYGNTEIDDIALECLDEVAGLCSDYIGNTVVQRFFEKCSENTKTLMLRQIGPHLAAGGIHKNGTWAVQKIIDNIKTVEQTQLVVQHMKPYVPSLLLDQFGNYAVQCCLGMGSSSNQFIFDAIVEKQHYIAQGRFGARAMRGILDNELVTNDQRIFVAAALTQNATSLAANPNGALILSWLIDSPKLNIPLRPITQRLVSQLARLCTHKVGSQTIMKLTSHERSTDGQDMVIQHLMNDDAVLIDILMDQTRGLGVIHKLVTGSRYLPLASKVYDLLAVSRANDGGNLISSAYMKLNEDLVDIVNTRQIDH